MSKILTYFDKDLKMKFYENHSKIIDDGVVVIDDDEIVDCDAEIIEDSENNENSENSSVSIDEIKIIPFDQLVANSNDENNENGDEKKEFTVKERNFHIVVNPKIADKLDNIKEYLEHFEQFNYILIGMHELEKDKLGNLKEPHYHIYVQYKNAVQLKAKAIHNAHLAKCFGSAQANIKYIRCKDDSERHKACRYTEIYEYGLPKLRGGALRGCEVVERFINNGYDMAKTLGELPANFYRVYKQIIEDYINENAVKRWRENVLKGKKNIKVDWHVGKGGSGKTYAAAEDMGDNALVIDFTKDGNFANILGNAKTADTIVLNEFKDSGIEWKTFLQILVNEKVINVKNSQIYPQHVKHIIITSQQYPHEIYRKAGEDRNQIIRRIDNIIYHEKVGEEYTKKLINYGENPDEVKLKNISLF